MSVNSWNPTIDSWWRFIFMEISGKSSRLLIAFGMDWSAKNAVLIWFHTFSLPISMFDLCAWEFILNKSIIHYETNYNDHDEIPVCFSFRIAFHVFFKWNTWTELKIICGSVEKNTGFEGSAANWIESIT